LATPTKHQSSPILLADVPKDGIQSELHIGEVPSDILRALRLTHAWLDGLFRGKLASVDDLERSASEISTETILPEPANSRRTPGTTRWYVTLIINDHIEIPRDSAQKLYGVELGSWANFDSSELFNKYEDALDFQAVQVAFLLAPYRYIWLAWDAPLVQLPTGITLRPPYFRLGRGRGLRVAAQISQGGNFSLSLMVERQRCRYRRNVHHLPIHPLHHPPDGLQGYSSIRIGHRNLRRHVEPQESRFPRLELDERLSGSDGINARLVPEQHSDRLQADELCFACLIGLLLGDPRQRPPRSAPGPTGACDAEPGRRDLLASRPP
jgi:hypothetical protein